MCYCDTGLLDTYQDCEHNLHLITIKLWSCACILLKECSYKPGKTTFYYFIHLFIHLFLTNLSVMLDLIKEKGHYYYKLLLQILVLTTQTW